MTPTAAASTTTSSATTATLSAKLTVRRVTFDWADTPLHWIPGDPQSSHTINVLHILLPAGERWFCRVYREALPLVTGDALRSDVKGFIGQEAVHARAHTSAVEWLGRQGIDAAAFADELERLANDRLGKYPFGSRRRVFQTQWFQRFWLRQRLAIVAAIEHFTGVLGDWVLNSEALDAKDIDPTMRDLIRWHGAEEVEHRDVAFRLANHFGYSYVSRFVTMIFSFALLNFGLVVALRYLMDSDPSRPSSPSWREFRRASRVGLLPRYRTVLWSVPRFLGPGYDPTECGSTEQALAYLSTSPAARESC